MSDNQFALRTPQIDSNLLDEDFQSINWEIFSSLFRYNYSHLIHSFKHEFQLFLRLLTSFNTLLSKRFNQTIGQQLLQTQYSTIPLTRSQKLVYLSSCLFSYGYEKYLVDYRRLLPFQFVYKLFLFTNFLIFLYQGKYFHIYERLTQMKTKHNHPPSIRILDYTYMKRELIWHTLNETLATIIPFLTSFKTRIFLRKYLSGRFIQPLKQTDQCAVCEQSIVMPHESIGSDCKHYFCYVCAFSLIEQSCPICFQTIQNIRRKQFSKE